MSDLKCIDCQQEFEFTDGEQKFYESKGFNAPKRCPDCRKKKQARKQAQERKDFNSDY